jgi:hypothetical protein
VPVTEHELARWVDYRRTFGLRTDLEWVLAVARNPEASRLMEGVPLLEFEEAQIVRLFRNAEALLPTVQGYGNRFRDEFGGAWIDAPLVTLGVTDRIAEHRAAVAGLFGDRVVVRQVSFTLRELNIFEADVGEQMDWIASIGVTFAQTTIDLPNNVVLILYTAPNQSVESQIRARFGDPGWMAFEYDGPGPWVGPRGDIELSVVDSNGRPFSPFECVFISLDPRVSYELPPRQITDGKCVRRAIEAVRWRVEITYEMDGELRTVSRELSVPPDGVARAKVVIEQ